MTKYRAKKTEIDGIVFDSKKEAKRYIYLKEMQEKGRIRDLKLQPEYELIPRFKKNGKTYRKATYRADFTYVDTVDGRTVVEDVKGYQTQLYKLKKKLFEYTYPDLELTEI